MTDFDTLAATGTIEAAGLNRAWAEAIAEGAARASRTGYGDLATKADMAADLRWMKRIGAVIVALLAVPLLRDTLTALTG
ncbi:MAG: hypothetical protein GDA53_05875 [Rhodobacteraceae bacterium]|nr:hypothetical protein [Paracoccaceae bacterium]